MKKFFQHIHLKFVEWFATFFLRHANKAVRRLLVVGGSYQDLSHLSTTLLSLTNEVVRQHIINMGKNPDLITLTPNPMAEQGVTASVATPDFTERERQAQAWEHGVPEGVNPAWVVDTKSRPNIWVPAHCNYVNYPSRHPVLESRAAFEAKQNPPETVEVNINITTDQPVPVVSEVSAGAIDALRDAVFNIEKGLDLPPIESSEDKKSE